jgi:hypothetical protein
VIRGTALLSDRPFAALAAFREAATSFRSAGDSAGLAGANSYLCIVLNNLGRCVEAQQVARDNIDWAAGSRSYLIETRSRVLLERSLHRCGDPPADPAFLAAGYDSPDQTVRSSARAMKAYRAFDAGQLDEAERIARPLMEVPIASAVARLILARVALARGRPADVLAIADSAVPFASHFAPDRADLDAVRIEALLALGETSRARELVRAARDRVESVADGIDDPGYRDSFRTGVAAHRAILEMAERVLGPRDEA